MTKYVLCPTYSDSLSFDVKRTHTANLTHKAQQPGAPTSKRMKTALEDARHMHTHLACAYFWIVDPIVH